MRNLIGEIKTIKKEMIRVSKNEENKIGIELRDGFDSCYEILENSEVKELIELLKESLK